MKQSLLILMLCIAFVSCEKYDQDVLPVVGTYVAHVVGGEGDFTMSINIDYGRNLTIDAPWDDYFWYTADAKLRHEEDWDKEIRIPRQWLDNGVELKGEGIYFDHSIQLDYTVWIDGYSYNYTIVGSKL
jgi:hypothetical protein